MIKSSKKKKKIIMIKRMRILGHDFEINFYLKQNIQLNFFLFFDLISRFSVVITATILFY